MGENQWTTELPIPEDYIKTFGPMEVHHAYFLPKTWRGKGHVVGFLIPECEIQICLLTPEGEPIAMVNRPQNNKNIKSWLRFACEKAREMQACFSLACDTTEQVERYAKRAARLLPQHERIALERMIDPATRAPAATLS
jgi:hypothetical protein